MTTYYAWHQLGDEAHAIVREHFLDPIQTGDEVTSLCEFTATVLDSDQRLADTNNVVPCLVCFAKAKKLAGLEKSNV